MRRAPLYALYTADAISLVGNMVAQLAIPWYVLITTGSAALTGLAVFFNFLPIVLAGFFGGVVVDRLGFRTTSVVADLASASAVAAIPLLHSTVGIELWQPMTLVFLGAPARRSGNDRARRRCFPTPSARGRWAWSGRPGCGARSSSPRCSSAGRSGACSSRCSARPRRLDRCRQLPRLGRAHRRDRPPRAQDGGATSRARLLRRAGGGHSVHLERRLIRAIVLTVLVTNFLDAPFAVVMPVFARDAFGSAADLGVMYGTFGGFALAGALTFSAVGHRLPKRPNVRVCFSVAPFAYLVLATLPSFPVALAALAAFGLAAGPINPLLERSSSSSCRPSSGACSGHHRRRVGRDPGGRAPRRRGRRGDRRRPHVPLHRALLRAVTGYGFFNPAFHEMDHRPAAPATEPDAAPRRAVRPMNSRCASRRLHRRGPLLAPACGRDGPHPASGRGRHGHHDRGRVQYAGPSAHDSLTLEP